MSNSLKLDVGAVLRSLSEEERDIWNQIYVNVFSRCSTYGHNACVEAATAATRAVVFRRERVFPKT